MSYDDLRYDEVRQKSAHNAFQQQEGIYDRIVYWRIRSLELDLHRGKLGYGRLKGDWFVYHGLHDPNTTVHRLSDFLRLCRGIGQAIPHHEVITVFLDIREAFHVIPSACDADIVFVNMSDGKVKLSRRVREQGLVSRSYYINDKARWALAVEHACHHIATDHIYAREDPWSQTARPETGFPFQPLEGVTPTVVEPGAICGVWARSGDIWGRSTASTTSSQTA